jgi:endo-1,4-beta-xylanase
MASDLKKKGVPIDGVGLQMHIGIGPREAPQPDDVSANMDRLAALGLEVQITEMDVKIQNGVGSDDRKLTAQASVYADMLHVCLQHKNCTAFLTWGFVDTYSWIPGFTGHDDAPLPFDKAYKPKPAYDTLLNVLSGQ